MMYQFNFNISSTILEIDENNQSGGKTKIQIGLV